MPSQEYAQKPIGSILDLALAGSAVGARITDPGLVSAFDLWVEIGWRSEMDQFEGWPDGHTTDGSDGHVCRRLNDSTIEIGGSTSFDFGPQRFVFRAHFFRIAAHGPTRIELSTQLDDAGGPRLYSDSPIVVVAEDRESLEVLAERRQSEVGWAMVIKVEY